MTFKKACDFLKISPSIVRRLKEKGVDLEALCEMLCSKKYIRIKRNYLYALEGVSENVKDLIWEYQMGYRKRKEKKTKMEFTTYPLTFDEKTEITILDFSGKKLSKADKFDKAQNILTHYNLVNPLKENTETKKVFAIESDDNEYWFLTATANTEKEYQQLVFVQTKTEKELNAIIRATKKSMRAK